MMRCSGGGPYNVKFAKARIQPGSDRLKMGDRGHAADGKPGLGADGGSIRLAQRFAGKGSSPVRIDPIAAGRDEQQNLTAGQAAEDDGFGDLVDVTSDGGGGIGCGACDGRFTDLRVNARGFQHGANAVQALAHGCRIVRISPACKAGRIDGAVGAPQCRAMSLSDRITCLPRAFDPDLGAETRLAVPALVGDMAALIEGAAGSSPYLKSLIEGEAHWLTEAVDDPEAAVRSVFETVRELAPDQLKDGLRQAKRRIALIVALADLAGAWSLAEVTGVLTEFADLACSVALRAEIARLIRRDKLPGQTEADIAEAGGMVVLAMGKMGAGELNYSSDIDLICLFDETRFDPVDYMDARQGFVKATRAMSAILNDRTAEGYVFRTDLRLRPDPAVTPVCLAMEAAERYYESLGRTWERAAYIKARPAAGDLQAGARFLDTLQPFVWRRHLDFAAIQDAHDMRLAIRETQGAEWADHRAGSRSEARPRWHPRDRVLHPDPTADRRRARSRTAPARHGARDWRLWPIATGCRTTWQRG